MQEDNKNITAPQFHKTAVKCRFFAQYFGQKVLKTKDEECGEIENYLLTLNIPFLSLVENNPENYHLELKSIENIKDKECCEIFDKFYPNAIRYSSVEKIVDIKTTIRSKFSEDVILDEDFIFFTDYMRGKGYALQFLNYSVDELVKMGWVQLV